MKPEDFDLFAVLVRQRSGLVLTRDKAYLLESRLLSIVRKYNLKTLEDMATALRSKRDEAMMADITDAMTTNESSFFRDLKPFNHFQKIILPQLIAARADRKVIRIWSAAASSGQEAYSLAMICAEEAAKLNGFKVEIIGTDISRDMVLRAKTGIYSQFEVQRGLPVVMLMKYFQQLSGDKWQIKETIRNQVQFKEGNLIGNLGVTGPFDVIFCRNVLIYFDLQTKTRVMDSLAGVMAGDGMLVLGGAETVLGVSEKFRPREGEHGIYVHNTASAAPMSQPKHTGTV